MPLNEQYHHHIPPAPNKGGNGLPLAFSEWIDSSLLSALPIFILTSLG
jgi:hypothetical protein